MSYYSKLAASHAAALLKLAPVYQLSDENLKDIKSHPDVKELAQEILANGPPFNEHEAEILSKAVQFEGHDFENHGDYWRDDLHNEYADKILQAYADNIENFEYKYKPEAQNYDESIDPNETHIGPMAQDIEKVNPAAIKESPDGIKSVDTGRLALMNAGAIAALARELQELKR